MAIEKFNPRKPIAAITKIVGDSRMLTVKEANELIDGINGTVETIEEEISNIPTETPDLQSVTDEGATTTNPITIGTATNGTAIQDAGVGGIWGGVPKWGVDNASGAAQFSSLTTSGPIADANGVIKPYKSFTAKITQAGTAIPTATILENNTGATPVFARSSAGVYTLTLNGVFVDTNKVWRVMESVTGTQYEMDVLNINTFIIAMADSVGVAADALLTRRSLEIRVYP